MIVRLIGGAPRSLAATWLALLVLIACAGCGSNTDEVRVTVRGNVKLNGKPLEAAAIVFHCGEGANEVKAFGFVENGTYEIDAKEGPLVGQARVEFQPKPVDPAEFEAALDEAARKRKRPKLDVVAIPPQYGSKSTLTADVAENGENVFDFDLKSRR